MTGNQSPISLLLRLLLNSACCLIRVQGAFLPPFLPRDEYQQTSPYVKAIESSLTPDKLRLQHDKTRTHPTTDACPCCLTWPPARNSSKTRFHSQKRLINVSFQVTSSNHLVNSTGNQHAEGARENAFQKS